MDKSAPWNLDLSIIIPVRDEERNIAGLAEELTMAMRSTPWSWECLWIDDGSTDNTLSELRQINKKDACHQFIALSYNYGQSAALSTGFSYARGEILRYLSPWMAMVKGSLLPARSHGQTEA